LNRKSTHPVTRICLTLLGIVLIVMALISSGVRLGLPLVANYKSTIESRVSDALRSPVAIGDLSLSWKGSGPVLKAEQVSVYESADRKVTLDALLIDVNLFKSLLRGVPIINELTLVGASLAVEADQAGQFNLHGMEAVRTERAKIAAPARTGRSGVDIMAWLLTARKVGLQDARITFIDQGADRQVVLEDLNIRAENTANMHQLRIDVRLPDELGGTLEAGIDLVGKAGTIRSSDGDLYVKANSVQVQPLLGLLKLIGLNLDSLPVQASLDSAVSLELWGTLKGGRLVSARGPLVTSPVVNTSNGTTVLDSISATLVFNREADDSVFSATRVILEGAPEALEIDSIQVRRSNASTAEPASSDWSVTADGEQLNVGSLGSLAALVMAVQSPQLASSLEQAAVRGDIKDWSLELDSSNGEPTVSIDAHLNQLSADPVAAMPGFGPVSGHISITDSVGEVSLFADAMALPWPAMTTRTLKLDSLKTVIGLNLRDSQRLLVDADIEVNDEGLDVSTRLKVTVVPRQSPLFDVQSRYSATDVTVLKRWLPRKQLSRGFSQWIDNAIQGGTATNGSMLFFGRLAEFPFEEGEGVFKASVDIGAGQVAFLPAWPTATGISGTLEVNGLALKGRADSSQLDKLTINQTTLRIDNLFRPVLRMSGTGEGVLQDVVDFGKTGPLKHFLEPALSDVTGSGNVDMDLTLVVPLHKQSAGEDNGGSSGAITPFSVDGSIFLNGNNVKLARADLDLSNVNGAVGFDQSGLRINSLKALVFSQLVDVNARTVGEAENTETRIAVTGSMKGSDVLAHYGSQLDQFVRGASDWQVELIAPHNAQRMQREGVSLHATSNLVGAEVLLPAPLYKTSGKAQAFALKTAFREGDDTVDWDIRLKGQAHVLARVEDSELESLAIVLGDTTLAPQAIDHLLPGIRIQGKAGRLAADDWVETINQLIDSFPDSEGAPEAMLPISASLDIESFELGTRSLGAARVKTNSDDTYLNTVLTNEYLEGSVRYPREYWSKEIPLIARMDHVDMTVIDALSEEDNTPVQRRPEVPMDPRLLPPVDARVASFTHGDLNVRDIVLRAQPDVAGLKVTTLGFAYQRMQLVGQGYWHLLDPQGVNSALTNQHLTQLNMVLQSDNFGEGLSAIGLTEVLSDGEGSIEMRLSWPGAAYLPSLDTLDGTISMALERGNIIPLEPGAGKMMGLFALQALPRRLNLDFRDISSDGLAFKRITGDATMTSGLVEVELIQLTGPIGVVDVVGQTDLVTRKLDQRITVLPRVSAALPIIGAISGGASAGVGVLVVAGLLKALGIDFDKLGLRDFSLTGTWDAPEFNSVATDYRRSR